MSLREIPVVVTRLRLVLMFEMESMVLWSVALHRRVGAQKLLLLLHKPIDTNRRIPYLRKQ